MLDGTTMGDVTYESFTNGGSQTISVPTVSTGAPNSYYGNNSIASSSTPSAHVVSLYSSSSCIDQGYNAIAVPITVSNFQLDAVEVR